MGKFSLSTFLFSVLRNTTFLGSQKFSEHLCVLHDPSVAAREDGKGSISPRAPTLTGPRRKLEQLGMEIHRICGGYLVFLSYDSDILFFFYFVS
jgi:hypothetical protein